MMLLVQHVQVTNFLTHILKVQIFNILEELKSKTGISLAMGKESKTRMHAQRRLVFQ